MSGREVLRRRRSRGFTSIEMVVALAVFGILLMILVGLQREFVKFDREMRVEFFTHPAPLAVLARLRHDIVDSQGYPESQGEYTQSPATLLLSQVGNDGKARVVVWDFRSATLAQRLTFRDDTKEGEWIARAVPRYVIGSYPMSGSRTAVTVQAYDEKGRLAVDQIIVPRAK